MVHGTSPGAKRSPSDFPTPTSNRSVFSPWSKRVSATSRTAVYGPVRTVVWEGRSREAPPYPDHWHCSDESPCSDSPLLVEADIGVFSSWSQFGTTQNYPSHDR